MEIKATPMAEANKPGKIQFWLFKSEPEEFSIDHLAASPNQTAPWTGVRNYMARNILRDQVKVGDQVFFYHSSTEIKGIAGICTVVRSAYPDPTALDPRDDYFDRKATAENPIWCAVDVQFVTKFKAVIPLATLKQTRGLETMMVCQRGARLSIQPLMPAEWKIILKMAQ